MHGEFFLGGRGVCQGPLTDRGEKENRVAGFLYTGNFFFFFFSLGKAESRGRVKEFPAKQQRISFGDSVRHGPGGGGKVGSRSVFGPHGKGITS